VKIFEPHAHMASRVTDDYERMALAGIVAICEPAFWQGQPRTSVGTSSITRSAARLRSATGRVSTHPPRLHDRAEPEGGHDGRVNQR